MKTSSLPEMMPFKVGENFKVLQVTGEAGAQVPLHYSTQEAVVIVQEGTAHLEIDEIKHMLQAGYVFIIPAGQNHTLTINVKFKAFVIMSKNSEVKFVK